MKPVFCVLSLDVDRQGTTFNIQFVVSGQLLTLIVSDFSATDNF
jgi:hypothetical protein